MTWILELYRSAMAKKAIMAVTGVMLFGFVLSHMVGNLKLFLGPEGTNAEGQVEYKIDVYAEGLREIGDPFLPHGQFLWIFRIALIAAAAFANVSVADNQSVIDRADILFLGLMAEAAFYRHLAINIVANQSLRNLWQATAELCGDHRHFQPHLSLLYRDHAHRDQAGYLRMLADFKLAPFPLDSLALIELADDPTDWRERCRFPLIR